MLFPKQIYCQFPITTSGNDSVIYVYVMYVEKSFIVFWKRFVNLYFFLSRCKAFQLPSGLIARCNKGIPAGCMHPSKILYLELKHFNIKIWSHCSWINTRANKDWHVNIRNLLQSHAKLAMHTFDIVRVPELVPISLFLYVNIQHFNNSRLVQVHWILLLRWQAYRMRMSKHEHIWKYNTSIGNYNQLATHKFVCDCASDSLLKNIQLYRSQIWKSIYRKKKNINIYI